MLGSFIKEGSRKRKTTNTAKSKSHWAAWFRRLIRGRQVLMTLGQAPPEGSAYPGALMGPAAGLSADASWSGSAHLLS